jgi:hypothetical protein
LLLESFGAGIASLRVALRPVEIQDST